PWREITDLVAARCIRFSGRYRVAVRIGKADGRVRNHGHARVRYRSMQGGGLCGGKCPGQEKNAKKKTAAKKIHEIHATPGSLVWKRKYISNEVHSVAPPHQCYGASAVGFQRAQPGPCVRLSTSYCEFPESPLSPPLPPPPTFHEAENILWLAEGEAVRMGSTPASNVTAVADSGVPWVATIITASPLCKSEI